MRLTTKRKLPLYQLLNVGFVIMLAAGIFLFLIDNLINDYFGKFSYIVLISIVVLGFLIYLRGYHIFEYDSDSESLTISNKSSLPFYFKKVYHDFPKYKLMKNYTINYLFCARLYLTISHRSVALKY